MIKWLKKLDKAIDNLYRPFAIWLNSLTYEEDVDWLKMSDDMIQNKDNKNEK